MATMHSRLPDDWERDFLRGLGVPADFLPTSEAGQFDMAGPFLCVSGIWGKLAGYSEI